MGNFFGGLFRGLIITILGVMAVYLIIFCVTAPQLPKNAGDLKAFVTELVDVKGAVRRMQNKSKNYLESKESRLTLEGDSMTPEQLTQLLEMKESPSAFETAENSVIQRQLTAIQRQLDRIENQNRQLTLRIEKLEKKSTE